MSEENNNMINPHQVVSVEDTLKKSYLDYAMSVIVGRALPDVRDGLKPVHRRVLFAMHEMGMEHNKPYRKSARIVGDVIGKYHPHGDQAAYDTLVRMAQEFSMRYPLVDGQGNFGSIDGDSAAAMRYTEVRMQKITAELLADLDKNTVDFSPNYDASLEEPTVFPTRIPNLLINGSSGIAVGMATNMPPHNLTEVMDALIMKVDDPNVSDEAIFSVVRGPDFPTRAMIMGRAEILRAYKTGRGSVKIRSRAEVEEMKGGREQIIVTELPYQTNKATLIEKIAELVHEKKIEGISDLRDESDENVRIVIELKRGEVADVILNQLYKFTAMESSFGINNVVLVNGRPKLVTLVEILDEFIAHRVVVVTRRTIFLLKKAEDRLHIIEGLRTAVANIDEVVAIVKASPDSNTAKEKLKERFALSEIQAQAIMEMRLSRLTGLEIDKLNAEYAQLLQDIDKLKLILSNRSTMMALIKDEFVEIKNQYGDERRTEIKEGVGEFEITDLIPNEEMLVTISHNGYIKRTSLGDFTAQKRGGKGKIGSASREDDFVERILVTTNHARLLFFTINGKVHFLNVYNLPEMNRDTKGRHISNFIALENGDKVASILAVADKDENKSIFFGTRRGEIKKIEISEFQSGRNGMLAMKMDDGDSLVASLLTSEDDKIFIATRQAKSIQFFARDIKSRKRQAGGVRGVRLGIDDEVVSVEVITDDGDIMTVTANGYGKRTAIADYREQSRGGSGLKLSKVTSKTGVIVGAMQVLATDELMLITKNGKTIRFAVSAISVLSRDTQGVRLMDTDGDEIISVAGIMDDGDEVIEA
ncbi:MAG: DNA gyrase subunit A [Deferribacteraceae bacterium]|jgi:DNA gyrase subunit A|nr:DNA gyrase subunit A [Deferribacteraceae bacterium]